MRSSFIASTIALAACGGSSSTPAKLPVDPAPPVVKGDEVKPPPPETPPRPKRPWPDTRSQDVADTVQGMKLADPYRWLEDDKSAEVQTWMKVQDDYARAELAKLPGRPELVDRLKQVFYFDAITAPQHRKGRFFFTRKHADKEKMVVYWRQGDKGAEKVLFDPNTWSTDGTKTLGGWWPSEDGKYAAYAVK